jgi:hypothetical protein
MSDSINTLYTNNEKILEQMMKDEKLKKEESIFDTFKLNNLDLNS